MEKLKELKAAFIQELQRLDKQASDLEKNELAWLTIDVLNAIPTDLILLDFISRDMIVNMVESSRSQTGEGEDNTEEQTAADVTKAMKAIWAKDLYAFSEDLLTDVEDTVDEVIYNN